jgi:spore germination protein GerM
MLLAAGCGIAADDQPRFDATGDVPFDLLGTTPPGTTAPAAPGGVSTRLCLLGADQLVHPVARSLPSEYQMIELADVLTAGPTDTERSYGLTTALAEPGTVTDIDVQGGVATVDLDPALAARPVTDQLTVVTQLVCTLTEQPGIGQVRFTVERVPIAVPRGDGSSTSDPVSRQDYETLIAAP